MKSTIATIALALSVLLGQSVEKLFGHRREQP